MDFRGKNTPCHLLKPLIEQVSILGIVCKGLIKEFHSHKKSFSVLMPARCLKGWGLDYNYFSHRP